VAAASKAANTAANNQTAKVRSRGFFLFWPRQRGLLFIGSNELVSTWFGKKLSFFSASPVLGDRAFHGEEEAGLAERPASLAARRIANGSNASSAFSFRGTCPECLTSLMRGEGPQGSMCHAQLPFLEIRIDYGKQFRQFSLTSL